MRANYVIRLPRAKVTLMTKYRNFGNLRQRCQFCTACQRMWKGYAHKRETCTYI